jgi:predicted RecB family nuclease
MLRASGHLQLSASDLTGHLNCRHLTQLEMETVNGAREVPKQWDPLLQVLWERGARHERNYAQLLRSEGYSVVQIEGTGISPDSAEQTVAAMKAGAEIVLQAAFLRAPWSGRADVLRRVDAPSGLGKWSYEVLDTKLARQTKAATVLQLCLYADLVASVQGVLPEYMYVVAPGSELKPQRFRTAAFAAYFRRIRRSLENSVAQPSAEAPTYPEPRNHCAICRWRVPCDAQRRQDDHLCHVAGITKVQIGELRRHNVSNVAELAHVAVPLPWKTRTGRESVV